MNREHERGFVLMDVLIVTAIVAIVIASAGTLFLGGLTPGVAVATADVTAALNETREAAMTADAATIVFTPARSERGFTARIYERTPGDALFRSRNGPAHESAAAAITEIGLPLGAPGFALSMDRRGAVTGYKNFNPGDSTFTAIACPPGDEVRLTIADGREARTVALPCALAASTTAAVNVATPALATVQTPQPAGTCPAASPCVPAAIVAGTAGCPAGYLPDSVLRGMCAPIVCPPGSTGTPPVCVLAGPPTPAPSPTGLPVVHVAILGCGFVETSNPESVSGIQHDVDGLVFVTYDDAYGIVQTHFCVGRTT